MLSLGLSLSSIPALQNRFSPSAISGLSLWLDASDADTISIATGVSQWMDKSGNGNHASQATGAKQPTVASAALNGRNTLAFSSAALQVLDLTTPITAVGAADPYTVFSVVKRAASNNTVVPVGSNDGAGAFNFPLFLHTDGKIYSASSVRTSVTLSTYSDGASYHQVASVHNASDTFDVYFDRAQITETDSGTARRTNWGCIGAGLGTSDFYTNGNIAEIIYYNRVLSAGEIAQVQAYQLAKWGV